MALAREDRPRLASKARLVRDRTTGREMLLYPERGLALNAVAAEVARRLDGARTVGEIAAEVAQAFGAGAEVEGDVLGFLDELAERADRGYAGASLIPSPRAEDRGPLPSPPRRGEGPEAGSPEQRPTPSSPSSPTAAPLRCPYCSNPTALAGHAAELSTDEWARVFAEAAALGVMAVAPHRRRAAGAARSRGARAAARTSGSLHQPHHQRRPAHPSVSRLRRRASTRAALVQDGDPHGAAIAGRAKRVDGAELGSAESSRGSGEPSWSRTCSRDEAAAATTAWGCRSRSTWCSTATTSTASPSSSRSPSGSAPTASSWPTRSTWAGRSPTASAAAHARRSSIGRRDRLAARGSGCWGDGDHLRHARLLRRVARAPAWRAGRAATSTSRPRRGAPLPRGARSPGLVVLGERRGRPAGRDLDRGAELPRASRRSLDARALRDLRGGRSISAAAAARPTRSLGDAAATDPACALAPRHDLVVEARARAAEAPAEAPLRLRRLRQVS